MEAHKFQRRKYTNEPYFGHLAEVAGIVAAADVAAEVVHQARPKWTQIAIAIAWLHDSIEDQEVPAEIIRSQFGDEVLYGVSFLSDLEEGNRNTRKALSRARLAQAPGWIQSIKCADLISNTKSIVMFDPKFAVTYLEEKRLLLDVLTMADPRLVAMARAQL